MKLTPAKYKVHQVDALGNLSLGRNVAYAQILVPKYVLTPWTPLPMGIHTKANTHHKDTFHS